MQIADGDPSKYRISLLEEWLVSNLSYFQTNDE